MPFEAYVMTRRTLWHACAAVVRRRQLGAIAWSAARWWSPGEDSPRALCFVNRGSPRVTTQSRSIQIMSLPQIVDETLAGDTRAA